MSLKNFFLKLLMMLAGAMLTAVLVITGNQYINARNMAGGETAGFSLFSSEKTAQPDLRFVEMTNLIITLKSDTRKERYLLLDLALTTHGEAESKQAEAMMPKIKGITVDVLSSMDYNELRNLSLLELRQRMMERYRQVFKITNVTLPFRDVIVSKMVFQ